MARDLKPKTPVAERLVAARLHLQLGRDELGAALDWNKSTLAKYEQGASQPDFGFLDRLQQRFGISLDWVITGRGEMLLAAAEKPVSSPSPASTVQASAVGIDTALMEEVARGIEAAVREEGGRIQALALVREAARLYDDLVSAYDCTADRLVGLKGLLQQFRRELRSRATAGDNSKQAS